jgi:salicylate hydroxylase
MSESTRIAIIGGGIGGLTAALALRQKGFEVEVFETAPELKEIGAGLDLGPNSIRVMRSLGLEDAVRAIGWHAPTRVWRHWKTGKIVTEIRQDEVINHYGTAGAQMHRADLLDVLAHALPDDVKVSLGAHCVGVENVENGARATFADGSVVEADIIVGADGVRSAVRASLFGEDPPRFTGVVCYRTVIPVAAFPDGEAIRDAGNSRGPHGLFVRYGVRRGELINVVCFRDEEGYEQQSWNTVCSPEAVREEYADWHESYKRVFDVESTWYKWPLFDRDPIPHWTKGRVTLLGDAAHPMLPYLGQGAAQALEDAAILSASLDANRTDIPRALALYEQIRIPRTSEIVLLARARAGVNHEVSPFAAWKRDAKIKLRKRFRSDPGGRGDSWIGEYDATDPSILAEASARSSII